MKTTQTFSKVSAATRPRLVAALLAAVAVAALPATVRAQTAVAEQPAARESRRLALTFAPLLLYSEGNGQSASILELTAELRVTPRTSVALVGGAGRIKLERTLISEELPGLRYDFGGQVRYYVLGDFNGGMQLGAEIIYGVDAYDDPSSMFVTFLQPAVFGGYKLTTDSGFTFDVQLGLRRIGETVAVGGQETTTARIRPMLNVNLGWSF